MNGLYNKLREQTELKEAPIKSILRKQASIYRLFPPFDQRVDQVANSGGIRLIDIDGDEWKFTIASASVEGKKYSATIHFANVASFVRKYGRNRKLWTKDKSRIDIRKLARVLIDRVDVEIDHPTCPAFCLTGDVMIPLLNGTEERIEKLAMMDAPFWVYSTDANGDFIPGRAVGCGITGYVDELIEVILDNGEKITCTPDHLFRLRNGKYLEAKYLKTGESLLPLYFKKSKKRNFYSKEYLYVQKNSSRYKNGRAGWDSVHAVVAKTIHNEEWHKKVKDLIETKKEDFLVVHHYPDFNVLNNSPENLSWVGNKEHNKIHGKIAREDTPQRRAQIERWNRAGIDKAKSIDGRKKNSEVLKRTWAEKRDELIAKFRAPKSEKHRCSLRNSWAGDEKRKEAASKRMREISSDFISEKNPFYGRNHSVETKNKIGKRTKGKSYEELYGVERAAEIKLKKSGSMVKTLEAKRTNHKVANIKLIKMKKTIPVYDIHVETHNNFLVAAGVIVHNSYWGQKYINTVRKTAYKDKEGRRPVIRNPKEYGALCKHLQLLFDQLPFYTQTFAKYLKNQYASVIAEVEKETKGEVSKIQKAATGLGRREKEMRKDEPKKGREKEVDVKKEEDDKQPDTVDKDVKGGPKKVDGGPKGVGESVNEGSYEGYGFWITRDNEIIDVSDDMSEGGSNDHVGFLAMAYEEDLQKKFSLSKSEVEELKLMYEEGDVGETWRISEKVFKGGAIRVRVFNNGVMGIDSYVFDTSVVDRVLSLVERYKPKTVVWDSWKEQEHKEFSLEEFLKFTKVGIGDE